MNEFPIKKVYFYKNTVRITIFDTGEGFIFNVLNKSKLQDIWSAEIFDDINKCEKYSYSVAKESFYGKKESKENVLHQKQ